MPAKKYYRYRYTLLKDLPGLPAGNLFMAFRDGYLYSCRNETLGSTYIFEEIFLCCHKDWFEQSTEKLTTN